MITKEEWDKLVVKAKWRTCKVCKNNQTRDYIKDLRSYKKEGDYDIDDIGNLHYYRNSCIDEYECSGGPDMDFMYSELTKHKGSV